MQFKLYFKKSILQLPLKFKNILKTLMTRTLARQEKGTLLNKDKIGNIFQILLVPQQNENTF